MNNSLICKDALRMLSAKHLLDSLLDSNLIVTTKKFEYNLKIIDCGNYVQVYSKDSKTFKSDSNLERFNDDIRHIDTDNLKSFTSNTIEKKNIIRSKLECQRLAKANSTIWSTFITLTFKDNIVDIGMANKSFRNFIDSIKRVFNEFKYICIPEFQKRGAVHYHLLSNIEINSNLITIQKKGRKKFYHIKYWNNGFNKVDNICGDIKKIIGYISKYMTKEIDNRLFNRHRYFYSRSLVRPKVLFIDSSKEKDMLIYNSLIKNKNIIYENNYISSYDSSNINFKEYL